MVWTREALEVMPVSVKKLHSDNGSEFINAHVQRYCREMGIQSSRSRPYRKNDAPYVESKNWTMVRAYTGWRRYDTEEELKILRSLMRLVSLKNNLFIPQMKLIGRHSEGRRVRRCYDMDIPFNRVVRLEMVDERTKERLQGLRDSIDIVRLSEEIEKLTEALSIAYEKKLKRRYKHA
jgi:hypothetical protein